MSACNETIVEKSTSVYFIASVATTGTPLPGVDIDADLVNIYKTVSVINDKDQDIRIKYSTDNGTLGEFIVPKSIKGFTKTLKTGKFLTTGFTIWSLGGVAAAGNVSFNFST